MHSRAEQLALGRLQHAFEHLAALRRLRIGDPDARHAEAPLGIPVGVAVADAQRRLRDEAEAAPLEVRAAARTPRPWPRAPRGCPPTARRACTGSRPPRGRPASCRSSITIDCRMSSGSKPGHDDRLALVARDPLVGPAADHRRDVAGPDERVEPHVGRIEDRADGRDDRDVVAEDREVRDALAPWRASASARSTAPSSRTRSRRT